MNTQIQTRSGTAGSMEGWKGGRLEGWGARLRSCFRSPIHPIVQSSNLPLILLTLALLAGLAPRAEAQRYWIATAPGIWNNTANWSASSGGAGPASVPTSAVLAIFDGAGGANGDCNITTGFTVLGINIGAGYGGTITQGNVTIGTGATGWTQAGGIFNGSASAINLSGPFNLSGGTFTCGNQTISMQGSNAAKNWTLSGSGTFNAGSGSSVNFDYNGSQTYTITGSTTFHNLRFYTSNTSVSSHTVTMGSGDILTVNGTLTMNCAGSGTIRVHTGTIEAKGDMTFGASVANRIFSGTATLIVNGTGPQTLTSNSALIPALNINKSSGTLDLSGIIETTNNWTYTPAGGTLNAGSSTVIFRKTTAPQTISGSHSLYNVTFRNAQNTAQTIDFASGTTLTITGTTTFDSTGTSGTRDLTINTGTIEAQGDVVVADNLVYLGSTAFNLTGTANQTFTSSGGSGTFRFTPVTINKASGTVTLGSNLQLNNAGQDLTWTSGGLDLSSYTLTVADLVTIDADATTLGVTVAGAAPSNGRLTCNSGAVNGIANVGLAMNITATPPISGQTYTILSRPAAVFSAFESESWSGDWTGTIDYNANGNTEVRLSNILETTGTAPSIDNLPVTSVTTVGASFNGNLVDIGTAPTTVSVRWANTEAALTGIYSSFAWNEGDWGNNSFPAYSGASLTPDLDYYYTFVGQSTAGTTLATPAQYLITGELTPVTTEGTCGATAADLATITISRPSTCKAGPLTVNYALSGATSYVSASPASGFTLAAAQESQTITFTPLQPNMGAPLGVTLTMLAGAYASDGLDSAAISVATAVGYTLTANTDTSIGTAMDVVETPPNTVAYSLAGSTYTYEFWASSLNLNGKRVYNTTGGRSVVLQNLAVLTDSGAGRIDTSTTASFTVGGGVTVQAAGGITLNGANGSGYAIDSSSTTPTIANRYSGGDVTLMTSGGVSLSAGGVRTEGKTGGRIWITDGAGGSAGNVSIAGNLYAASTGNTSDRDGSVQVRGATVTIAGNVVTTASGTDTPGKPITLVASGPLSVGGYLAAEQSYNGFGGSGGAVTLSGTTVTVSGSLGGLSINTSAAFNYNANVGGNISVTATAGDLTLAGGVDASHPSGVSRRGTVALSAPNGTITVGSLDASKFKSIAFVTGPAFVQVVQVSGVLTNFPVNESPKRITFPTGSTLDGDIYYQAANNTAIPLTGTYDIYVNGVDTGWDLKDGYPIPQTLIQFQ